MNWKDDYATGIAEIDRQHRLLVRGVTDIENAIRAGDAAEAVRAIVSRFMLNLQVHFSTEETLMRSMNYAGLAAHIREHESLMAEIRAIESRALGSTAPVDVTERLEKWLEDHFTSDDRHYAGFFDEYCPSGEKFSS